MEPGSIEKAKQLAEELRAATADFMKMQRIAVKIVMEAPSGLPIPDGQARILRAFHAAKMAFEDYQRALKRYRAFITPRGMIRLILDPRTGAVPVIGGPRFFQDHVRKGP
jgi:hypothetical protein